MEINSEWEVYIHIPYGHYISGIPTHLSYSGWEFTGRIKYRTGWNDGTYVEFEIEWIEEYTKEYKEVVTKAPRWKFWKKDEVKKEPVTANRKQQGFLDEEYFVLRRREKEVIVDCGAS